MIRPDRWMHHTAVIRPFLRQGVSAPEYGEPIQVKCLLSLGRKLTYRKIAAAAQEIVASGKAYFPAGTRIEPQDSLEIMGQRYMALSCQPRYDWNGMENHVEVTLQ